LPPAVTISGTPTAQVGLYLQCDGAGTRGTATFKWSVDNGATFVATGVLTAATVVLGTTGITAAFPVGAYLTDNIWRCTVSGWADQGGAGADATQAIASRQALFNIDNFNGRPSLRFDPNINGSMLCDSVAASFSGTDKPLTVLAAVRIEDTARLGAIWSVGDAGAARIKLNGSTVAGKLVATRIDNASATVGLTTTEATTTATRIIAYNSPGTTMSIYINDVVTSVNASSQDVGASTLTLGMLGATTDLGETIDMSLAELVAFAGSVTAAHQSMIAQYMANHNGFTI
jgi:hypothetical protein